MHAPYKDYAMNHIYNLLFCDSLELFKNSQTKNMYPWNIILAETPDQNSLNQILKDTSLETRTKILAHKKLKELKENIVENELMAIIIEVHLPDGLDTLATYKDGSARYINHSEKLIVWDIPSKESNNLIENIFTEAHKVISTIGPWNEKRLPPPQIENVRITFLVNGDIYFGEGTANIMFTDKMAGPVLNAGAQLMQFLMQKSLSQA